MGDIRSESGSNYIACFDKILGSESLAKLARRLLCTPASSVYSERIFSEFGEIYDDQRSRILPARGEKLLFIHHNYRKYAISY